MYSNNPKYRNNSKTMKISFSNNRHRNHQSSDQQDYNKLHKKRTYKRNPLNRGNNQIDIVSSQNQQQRTKKSRKERSRNHHDSSFSSQSSSNSSDVSQESGVIKFKSEEGVKKNVTQKQITPWLSSGTKSIKDSLLRFHNQIIEFYNYIKPSKKNHTLKLKRFNFIKDRIIEIFPQADVIAFGSFATQLYLPDGDIDIAVLTNGQYQASEIYTKVNKYLQSKQNSSLFNNIEYIRKSKVPLIKFEYEGTHFDISVDKTDGISQIQYVRKIDDIFPEFKYLTLVLKCSLRIRGLSDTYTGGIGSFLLSCMLWVYLKNMWERRNYYNLAEHVLEFIKFYAFNQDFWKNKVVYVKDGAIRDRTYDGVYFSCVSPQDQSHDIGKSAFKIRQVFSVLKNRCRFILDNNFQPEQSILRVLVNPSDQPFRYLKQFHE